MDSKINMKKIFSEAFEDMGKRYDEILKQIYPAQGDTGFTESNMVHNFLNSFIKTIDDDNAVEWMEFPLDNKLKHMDAMIYSPKKNAIFFIEAKRFSEEDKFNELKIDIARINELFNSDGFNKYINKYCIKEEGLDKYIIYLADVWLENDWKKSVSFFWVNEFSKNGGFVWYEENNEMNNIETYEKKASEENYFNKKKYNNYLYWVKKNLRAEEEKASHYFLLGGYFKV